MCRWMAWTGQSLLIGDLLFDSPHGLVDQSLHSKLGAETTNGDGFGLGWYGQGDGPARYRSIKPAWGDDNLREIARHVTSPLFLAHVRAAVGSPVQESNCHPFRHGRWLFVHNGVVEGMHAMRRELMLAVAPELFPEIEGTTDSEVLFHLALSFGLEEDPLAAMERTLGLVEATARAHGIVNAIQASIGISDGERLWAIRYSTEGHSRTLFHSAEPDTIRALYPDHPRLSQVRDDDHMVVSEPFSDLPGVWIEIPEATALVVQQGEDRQVPFRPRMDVTVNGQQVGTA